MLYISFTEILSKAQEYLGGDTASALFRVNIGFFSGILFMILLSIVLPENKDDATRLTKAGVYASLATTVHNFPEGLVTFMAVLDGSSASLPTFFAIALHNIPEGVAAALPTAHGTKSKLKGFLAASVSAVAEPLGALIGWFLLKPIINDTTNGIIFAASAGIMVYLCFDELLPLAYEYCGEKKSVTAIICGFAVMALSLTLLNV